MWFSFLLFSEQGHVAFVCSIAAEDSAEQDNSQQIVLKFN